ncbi:hypothetical protein IG631_24034 [Alternaria alternata]|nr:hypothetical protein IG631_24034 [Alternaria alternata]
MRTSGVIALDNIPAILCRILVAKMYAAAWAIAKGRYAKLFRSSLTTSRSLVRLFLIKDFSKKFVASGLLIDPSSRTLLRVNDTASSCTLVVNIVMPFSLSGR